MCYYIFRTPVNWQIPALLSFEWMLHHNWFVYFDYLRQGCTVKFFFQSISWNTVSAEFHETWNTFMKYFCFSKSRNDGSVCVNIFSEFPLTDKFWHYLWMISIHWHFYITYTYTYTARIQTSQLGRIA